MIKQFLRILIVPSVILLLPHLVFAVSLNNPLGDGTTIYSLIGRLIKFLLGLSGSVALLMFVWGGFQYLWSAGDDNKVKMGKKTISNAALGLVIIFSSYMLISTLIKALTM